VRDLLNVDIGITYDYASYSSHPGGLLLG